MLNEEIENAVWCVNSKVKHANLRKKEDEIKRIIKKAQEEFDECIYDFSKMKTLILSQGTKKRYTKQFADRYSTENILCECIKRVLDKELRLKYPNRNKISKSLFNTIGSIHHMSDFTIIRFDFKDYFNSVSTSYVFNKYIKYKLRKRCEIDLIEKYTNEIPFAYAGLQPSNAIAEIIAKEFDCEIERIFSNFGLLYFERYIDDGVIVLNQNLTESESLKIIESIIKKIFFDSQFECKNKCSTQLNMGKFQFISKRMMSNMKLYSFDFLGYEFDIKNEKQKIVILYGITQQKMNKYERKIKKIILLFSKSSSIDNNELELLRHRIVSFISREVYLTKKYNSTIWIVKGFISNYGELRYLLESKHIKDDTKNFLQNMIKEAFNELKVDLPYFIKGDMQNVYSLYHSMMNNKTLLFEQHIGYSKSALIELCKKINISSVDSLGNKRSYGQLVREYLIETKVGF